VSVGVTLAVRLGDGEAVALPVALGVLVAGMGEPVRVRVGFGEGAKVRVEVAWGVGVFGLPGEVVIRLRQPWPARRTPPHSSNPNENAGFSGKKRRMVGLRDGGALPPYLPEVRPNRFIPPKTQKRGQT